MRIIPALLLLALVSAVGATTTADLTASQVSLFDWSQGGEESLSWQLTVRGSDTRAIAGNELVTNYGLRFGQAKAGDRSLRKADDRINADLQYTVDMGKWINPFVAVSGRSQVAPGYRYGPKREVSSFFDPAYLSQSAGGGIKRGVIRTRLGFAVQQLVRDGTKIEGGYESVTSLDWAIDDKTTVTGRAEIFSPLDASTWRLQGEIGLRTKLYKGIAFTAVVEVVRDQKMQARSVSGLGLTWSG